jgi:hypothetical protein
MSMLRTSPAQPTVLFQGTFNHLQTFWRHRNAAPAQGGIACEDLEGLLQEAKKQFPDEQIACNPYLFPAQIQTQGPSTPSVDAFIRKSLSEKKIQFDYQG